MEIIEILLVKLLLGLTPMNLSLILMFLSKIFLVQVFMFFGKYHRFYSDLQIVMLRHLLELPDLIPEKFLLLKKKKINKHLTLLIWHSSDAGWMQISLQISNDPLDRL